VGEDREIRGIVAADRPQRLRRSVQTRRRLLEAAWRDAVIKKGNKENQHRVCVSRFVIHADKWKQFEKLLYELVLAL
jgi:hypothetical protein